MSLPRAALALALAAAAPAPAHAEPVLALRLGVAPAIGNASGNLPMTHAVPVQVPLQLEALWREGAFAGGLYGAWAPAEAGGCAAGETCTARAWRAGAQGTFTFRADGFEPWAGLALGWEWATLERDHSGAIVGTWSGPEVSAQGGAEWLVARWLALGPYALVGGGQYQRYAVKAPAGSASAAISDRALHVWLELGVRGRLVWGGWK